ncbi:hypothetical protein EDD22DRAFT_854317 [Suillus occidentalis]|nr:hypothetical protein EDD22DRAFT_854317 [Suillus occidentalis]
MSSNWITAFKTILDQYEPDILAEKSAKAGKPMVKKIRKEILKAHKEQGEDVPLPDSLKKAIKQYYAKILVHNEEAEEREATSHPREASFYKKSLTEWDVAQKLFKQEMDAYDKAEQQRKGLEKSIKYRTGHAREWFDAMSPSQQKEVKSAMAKWNKEGAPEESQAMYRKNNLKKILDDFSEQVRRTMGCRVVMFVSHKKKASQTLSVSLHETNPQNVKKRFSVSSNGIKEWTATDPSDGQDQEGSDNEDDRNEHAVPEIVLDDDGYAKLPPHDGIGLKGQHELIRSIFHASYKVCTGGSRPVPWGMITTSPSNYLERGSVPPAFVVKDPSHMKTDKVNCLWKHWEQRSAAKKKLVIFIKAKDSDIRANIRNEEWKRKSKEKRLSRPDSDEEDLDQDQPPAESSQAETTPDDVPTNDRYTFLKSLTKDENYLDLVEATQDLAVLAKQKPCSEQHSDLPTWANWSWGGSFLPEDVHVSFDTLMASLKMLETSPISGAPSVMPVVLGLGLLHRESKRVMEYEEDEAHPNTPFYLPGSAFDLQFLVALDGAVKTVFCKVVENIERLTAEELGPDNDLEDEDLNKVMADTRAVVEKEALENDVLDQEKEKEKEQEEEKEKQHEQEEEEEEEEEEEDKEVGGQEREEERYAPSFDKEV